MSASWSYDERAITAAVGQDQMQHNVAVGVAVLQGGKRGLRNWIRGLVQLP